MTCTTDFHRPRGLEGSIGGFLQHCILNGKIRHDAFEQLIFAF
jgi:hypothetical protein